MSDTSQHHWILRRLVIPMVSAAITFRIVHLLPHELHLPHGIPDILTHPVAEIIAEAMISLLIFAVIALSVVGIVTALFVAASVGIGLWVVGAPPAWITLYCLLLGGVWGFLVSMVVSLGGNLATPESGLDYDESIGPDPGGPPAGCGVIVALVFIAAVLACALAALATLLLHGFARSAAFSALLTSVVAIGVSLSIVSYLKRKQGQSEA